MLRGLICDLWEKPGTFHIMACTKQARKIRVVLGCSAEFEVRSINQELLSGPDLTNQIVGILTRF